MVESFDQALGKLLARHLPGLEGETGWVLPDYERSTLANLAASLAAWLGISLASVSPPFSSDTLGLAGGHFQHEIVLLADGLGLGQFQRLSGDFLLPEELRARARLVPLTSVVPSTTSSALTSLWTGLPPAEHGVLGYEMWLKEYGMVANMISFSAASLNGHGGDLRAAGLQPESFLPMPTLGTLLSQQGVRCFAFQPKDIAHSALSEMLFRGADVIPYRSLGDLWVSLDALLAAQAGERTLVYVYWGVLDELEHRFGPADERVSWEWRALAAQLGQVLGRLAGRPHPPTLFLLTADHGQVATPKDARYDLRCYPDLWTHLTIQPTSESRLPFLYLRPGEEQELRLAVERSWPGEFRLISAADALRSGLFGETTDPSARDRLGDWVAIPTGGAYWWWANRENSLLGRHGGLSPEEMLIPLYMLPL